MVLLDSVHNNWYYVGERVLTKKIAVVEKARVLLTTMQRNRVLTTSTH